MSSPDLISIDDVRSAARVLDDRIRATPLLAAGHLSRETGGRIRLKCESFQRGRSFKVRGALNTLSRLNPESIGRGVVAYSSGNHGRGVALAARLLGTEATIVVPVGAVACKVEGIEREGGRIVEEGTTTIHRRRRAEEIAEDNDLPVVPGFDHPHTIAGQGTVGLEIVETWPGVDTVLVPVGGGGLLAGIATAIRARAPHARIIGVEPENAPSMTRALESGKPVTLSEPDTIADGLAAVKVSELTLSHVRSRVDDVVTVSDDELREATRVLALKEKLVVEFSGAAGVAAILSGKVPVRGRHTAIVVSGGNIDAPVIGPLLAEA